MDRLGYSIVLSGVTWTAIRGITQVVSLDGEDPDLGIDLIDGFRTTFR